MIIQIVNGKDEIIGKKERNDLNYEKDIYRVSALWIKNSEGKNLLAQRAFTKKHHPGKWGPAVAGTVEEEETYFSNILKEAEEELGLKNIKPEKILKEFVNKKYKHFTQWYFLRLDKDIDYFMISKEEVEGLKWVETDKIIKLIENDLTVTLSSELIDCIKEK